MNNTERKLISLALKNDISTGVLDKRTYIVFESVIKWLAKKYPKAPKINIEIKPLEFGSIAVTPNYHTIVFNEHFIKNFDTSVKLYDKSKPRAKTNLSQAVHETAIHEFGHALSFYIYVERNYLFNKVIKLLFPKIKTPITPNEMAQTRLDDSQASVSIYGASNILEYLAETFAAVNLNRTMGNAASLVIAKALWKTLYGFLESKDSKNFKQLEKIIQDASH